MSHSACNRPRPSWTLCHRWCYSICWIFNLLPWASATALCSIPGRGRNINHSWIQQQYHLQHHSPAHVQGHWSRILLCLSSATSFDSSPRPGPRVLSFMWAATRTYPSCNDLYLSRVRHRWMGDHQSLGRLFKTNQTLQTTCLRPPP